MGDVDDLFKEVTLTKYNLSILEREARDHHEAKLGYTVRPSLKKLREGKKGNGFVGFRSSLDIWPCHSFVFSDKCSQFVFMCLGMDLTIFNNFGLWCCEIY